MTTLQEIYQQVNAFRQNPEAFNPSCVSPPYALPELQILPGLEAASVWQATHQCEPITHQTCPQWCSKFNGRCDHISRIKYFMFPNRTSFENEVLVKGPKRPFKHLVAKEGHCRHMLDPNVNSMGGAIVGNLFILAMVWLM